MNQQIFYTYLLKNKTTGLSYYGVRYGKNCHPNDFWKTYFTSSKVIKSLILTYGKDDFVFQIRKTFLLKENAIKWENKVNRRLTVKSKKFLNKGYIHSMNSKYFNRKCISLVNLELNKEIKFPEDLPIPADWVKGRLCDTNKGKIRCHNPLTGEELVVLTRSEIPPGYKQGVVSRKPFNNPNTGEQSTFSKFDQIPEGWVPGSIQNTISDKIACFNPLTNKIKFVNDEYEIPKDWIKGIPKSGLKDKISIFNVGTGEEKMINKNSEIPDGWKKGKPSLKTRPVNKTKLITNVETGNYIVIKYDEQIPDGYIDQHPRKGIPNTWSKKLKWFTNVETNQIKMLDPDNVDLNIWVLGRGIKNQKPLVACSFPQY